VTVLERDNPAGNPDAAREATTSEPERVRALIVEDSPDTADWMRLALERAGYDVRVAADGDQAVALHRAWPPDIVLLDLVLPGVDGIELLRRFRSESPESQVIVVTGHGSISTAVEAMTAGAYHFIEKPVDVEMLTALVEKAVERAALASENRILRQRVHAELAEFGEMLTRSVAMKRVFDAIKSVAPTDANVLIAGENGTGKELVADALHQHSLRANGPLVKINCAAIPADLVESELFGYKRGAFTGAVMDKVGLFEQARGGTLLLDEIGEMPAHLQSKLLRVLQDRQARPIGGQRVVNLDFRLVCATNCNLQLAMQQGKFREDLYFRINTFTVDVPPLRERPEDIDMLARHFLGRFSRQYNRPSSGFTPDAFEALLRHAWPGNVRELEHAIERAVIVATRDEITIDDLPEAVRPPDPERKPDPAFGPSFLTLAEIERMAILGTLEHTRGNKRAAAAILGLHRPTLYSKLRKYGLFDFPQPTAGATPPAE
jgi:DNA-binding NtrC family response regulator